MDLERNLIRLMSGPGNQVKTKKKSTAEIRPAFAGAFDCLLAFECWSYCLSAKVKGPPGPFEPRLPSPRPGYDVPLKPPLAGSSKCEPRRIDLDKKIDIENVPNVSPTADNLFIDHDRRFCTKVEIKA